MDINIQNKRGLFSNFMMIILTVSMLFILLFAFAVNAGGATIPVVTIASNNGYTNNVVPPIYIRSDPNATITVCIDGKDQTNPTYTSVSGDCTYLPPVPLTEGTHSVKAKVLLNGTTYSDYGNEAKIIIRLTPPSSPVFDTKLNNLLTKASKPSLYGTADANTTVLFNVDNTDVSDKVIADSKGKWSYTLTGALTDGSHVITAKAVDQAGNTGVLGTPITIMVDLTPPTAPVLVKPRDGDLLNSNKAQAITGTSEPNASISIKIDGAELIDIVKADVYGMWTFTPPITYNDGIHTIAARQRDLAGNYGEYCSPRQFTIDTAAPSMPAVTQPVSDTLTNNPRPQIMGMAEANANLLVTVDGKDSYGVSPVDASGSWSYVPPANLSDGVHKFSIKVSDAAGNVSSAVTFNITIDSTKPDLPVILSPSQNDTLLPKLMINGTAENSATIQIKLDSTMINDSVYADKSGKWKYTFNTDIKAGAHTIYVNAKDTAGNISDTASTSFKVVTEYPIVKPVILKPANNLLINTARPKISGTAEPFAKVILSTDGKDYPDTITANSSGRWSVILSKAFADGGSSIDIRAISALYKNEVAGDSIQFTVDTVAPAMPTLTDPVNNGVIIGNSVEFVGMGEPGSTIIIMIDDKHGTTKTFKAKASDLGSWSIAPNVKFNFGTYMVAIQAVDDAGNKSKLSSIMTVTFKKQ